jgi:ankyrin repeat protein
MVACECLFVHYLTRLKSRFWLTLFIVISTMKTNASTLSKSLQHDLVVSAIKNNDVKALYRLNERGVDINRTLHGLEMGTTLSYAVYSKSNDVAKYLLANGASLMGRGKQGPYKGWSAVHLLCEEESQLGLLQPFLDQDRKSGNNCFSTAVSPIHIAVANQNQAALAILLKHIESMDTSIACLQSQAHQENATEPCNNSHRISLLELQISLSDSDHHWTLRNEEPYSGKPLTTRRIPSGTVLHLAANINNISAVEELLGHGCNVDALDNSLNTPLHIAARKGNTTILDILIKGGANIAAQNFRRETPAMVAAQSGKLPILERLYELGLDDGHRSHCGSSIMHFAALGNPHVFAYLLNLGFDPYVEDEQLRITPLHFACEAISSYPSFSTLLCNANIELAGFRSALFPRLFNSTLRPVKMFIRRLGPEVARRLINYRSEAGECRKHLLCEAIMCGATSVIDVLIDAGAELELEDERIGTPLVVACSMGRIEQVKRLVFAGARIGSEKGARPLSALKAAEKFPDIVKWLLVGRFSEQGKLEQSPNSDSDSEEKPWAGSWSANVLLPMGYLPDPALSDFDRLVHFSEVRRKLLGKIVHVLSLV